jgi:archaetidylinositol phosphate synthase
MEKSIYRLKPYKDQQLRRLAGWLLGHRVQANQVTLAGFLVGLAAAAGLAINRPLWGAVLILLSAFLDLLDGTVARLQNGGTFSGKLYDAVSDRLVEIAWVGALVSVKTLDWWAWFLPAGSVLLLLARIVAHRAGLETSFVRVTRFERVVAILAAILFPWPVVTVPLYLAVAGGTLLSAGSILMVVWRRGGRLRPAPAVIRREG